MQRGKEKKNKTEIFVHGRQLRTELWQRYLTVVARKRPGGLPTVPSVHALHLLQRARRRRQRPRIGCTNSKKLDAFVISSLVISIFRTDHFCFCFSNGRAPGRGPSRHSFSTLFYYYRSNDACERELKIPCRFFVIVVIEFKRGGGYLQFICIPSAPLENTQYILRIY